MSTPDSSCKDGMASKLSSDDVCEVMGKLSTADNKDGNDASVSVCANCGSKEVNSLKSCTACKMVKYCNRDCQIAHRPQHKKECRKRAAELHDEKLFKLPPPDEDCPICFVRLPSLKTGWRYMTCCGKRICSGCAYAPLYDNQGNEVDNEKCAFCRVPTPSSHEEIIKRRMKRVASSDPIAIHNLGCHYRDGEYGFAQNYTKASELFLRAGELGHSEAYVCIGYAYDIGRGVDVDKKKAVYYNELAAIRGSVLARHNLGLEEERVGNMDRALKHYMIAVGGGYADSLDRIKELYSDEYATKEEYKNALQLYQACVDGIKSKQRDKVAASRDDCIYL